MSALLATTLAAIVQVGILKHHHSNDPTLLFSPVTYDYDALVAQHNNALATPSLPILSSLRIISVSLCRRV
jgi:hypothetical protein